ncbi:hypothetical protein [Pediococcus argentinicus]|uniref:Uncharacterized protein n=1 Tax=Pediococcus argentinicus TaxID=480391 RepID=A0A0R2NEP1_9LACO|nr:hypothetical protein [Pediococcus argentinicus]KRO22720.1 hypothetical protein IV88_GL001104 [Pediococcus argentinicus]NKZ23007.1 hypothetical protein [Pediococcus argentinicus]GEP20076.1 hypothetical protein LSA03_14600 [Pediococcus argentinicus]
MIARIAGWLFVPLFGYLFVWCIRAIPKAREIQKENAKRIDADHTRDYQKLGGSWGNGYFFGMVPIQFVFLAILSGTIVISLIISLLTM